MPTPILTDIEKLKVTNRCHRLLRLVELKSIRLLCLSEAMLIISAFTPNGKLDELTALVEVYVARQKAVDAAAEAYEKEHGTELDEMFSDSDYNDQHS